MYTNKIIAAFNAGTLCLPGKEGVTLRAYLAQKLGCDPMRITKKYTGASCLGKRVYHGVQNSSVTMEQVNETKKELEELEVKFREKLEQTKREKRDYQANLEHMEHYITTPAIDAVIMQVTILNY